MPSTDQSLWRSFIKTSRLPHQATDWVECRHCSDYQASANVTRMKQHLHQCKDFLDDSTNDRHAIVVKVKNEELLRRSQSLTSLSLRSEDNLTQSMLRMPRFSSADQKEADELVAIAIFCTGSKLSLLDYYRWQRFLRKLNPVYRISYRNIVGGLLLDQAYKSMKQEVMSVIQSSGCINFVIDGSDNVNQQRITNLSCSIEGIFYYLCNEDIPGVKHDTQLLAQWIDNKILEYCNWQPLRINFYAIDTENKMRAVHTILSSTDDFKHVFWIPCDSYGLQLLMRDIAELPWFAEVFKQVSSVVNYFYCSGKQIAMLRKYQMREYKKLYSITLSVITRWGTQVSILAKASNFVLV